MMTLLKIPLPLLRSSQSCRCSMASPHLNTPAPQCSTNTLSKTQTFCFSPFSSPSLNPFNFVEQFIHLGFLSHSVCFTHYLDFLKTQVRLEADPASLWMSNYSSTICRKGYVYSIELLLYLCQNQLGIFVWVYFWALCSVLLIHMSILLPLLYSLDYSGYISLKSGR